MKFETAFFDSFVAWSGGNWFELSSPTDPPLFLFTRRHVRIGPLVWRVSAATE